jgi:hypothetical protein
MSGTHRSNEAHIPEPEASPSTTHPPENKDQPQMVASNGHEEKAANGREYSFLGRPWIFRHYIVRF